MLLSTLSLISALLDPPTNIPAPIPELDLFSTTLSTTSIVLLPPTAIPILVVPAASIHRSRRIAELLSLTATTKELPIGDDSVTDPLPINVRFLLMTNGHHRSSR